MALIDDLAGIIGPALDGAGMSKPATLIVVTAGTRTAGSLSGGTNPTSANYTAKGLVAPWKRERLNATLVQSTDRVVMLYAALIEGGVVPKIGDKITIEGLTSTIVDIDRDSAAATYSCLTRK